MDNFLKTSKLSLLTKEEQCVYSGGEGEPTEDTGFWYDAFYVFTFIMIVNPKPTSLSTTVMTNMP